MNIIQRYEAEQITRLSATRGVPDVLLSGHHGAVAAWRQAEAERVTRDRRPDLWQAHMVASPADAP